MRAEESNAGIELTEREYGTLRRATETYREELILRLGAEVGLRPSEIARIRPEDVTRYRRNGTVHYLLSVPGADDDRTAYVPADVEHDLRKFVRTEAVGDGERVVPVSERRVQMIVSEVADRAADRTGNAKLGRVSSRTLRQYFARRRLVSDGLDPRVVQAVGGWERLDSFEEYVTDPDVDDVVAAFERTDAAPDDRSLSADTFRAAVAAADVAMALVDATGVVEYVNEAFESLSGYEGEDVVGRPVRTVISDADTRLDAARWTGADPVTETVTLDAAGGDARPVTRTVAPVVERGAIEWFAVVLTEADRAGDTDDSRFPERLDAVFDSLCAVGNALATASTRTEICRQVCATLVDGSAYSFAWVGEHHGTDVELMATAGPDGADPPEPDVETDAVQRAIESVEVQATDAIATDDSFETWHPDAESAGYSAGAVVPITDGETVRCVLGLGTTDGEAFGERERRLLADLGARIDTALTAAEHQKLLLADTTIELELESTDAGSFFAAASAEHGCTFSLEGLVPAEEGSLLYFVWLTGTSTEDVLEWADGHDAVTDARLVRDYGEKALLEFVVAGDDCAKSLIECGATVREMTAEGGSQRIVGDVSADADVRAVLDELTASFPATELLTKRERQQPAETPQAFRSALRETLTEKQAAVLQAAYHAGYFEWPRGSTAEELADSIGITSPTLHNHLRRAQQKLLEEFFESETGTSQRSPWND